MREPFHGDGAGTLIHDDGTPLSADEIAELERHELNDDPADDDVGLDEEDDDVEAFDRQEDGDAPADPDGPAPDEDDDLADLPFA